MPLSDPDARRAYHKAYMKRYLAKPENKTKHIVRARKNDARYKQQVDQIIAAWKVDGCRLCHEVAVCCLVAHHVDPTGKDFSIGDGRVKKIGPKRIAAELAKCVCLCSNCHAKVHAGLLSIDAS
jgi:hypothetical protein